MIAITIEMVSLLMETFDYAMVLIHLVQVITTEVVPMSMMMLSNCSSGL